MNCFLIQKSSISNSGNGVFSKSYISKGKLIVKCSGRTYLNYKCLSKYQQQRCFYHPSGKYFLSFGIGGMFQHKLQPNARWAFEDNGLNICFYALRDISYDEEIFIDYHDPQGQRVLKSNEIEIWEEGFLSVSKIITE